MLIVIGILAGCSGMDKQLGAVDPRPAYHLVSVTEDGVSTYDSHDGINWNGYLHKGLSRSDCFDVALSPDGGRRFLVYNHTDKNGKHTLNVLRGSGTTDWSTSSASLAIPETVSCGQPQMRHLRANLYGILWLDEGTLYSAVYDAGKDDGNSLTLSEPLKDDWLRLVEIPDLSFAYHNSAIYVVWSANSKDRIMTVRWEITGQTIKYGEPDYHLEEHTIASNMISDGKLMAIAIVTGKRTNILLTSDDGSYWDEGPRCYNIDNMPLFIPFLYKDARGEKIYLRTNDYAGRVTYLQNFSDCEKFDLKIPSEPIRIEYFPGR